MKRRWLSFFLSIILVLTTLSGCLIDDTGDTQAEEIDYDPAVEVAKFDLPELTEEEKNFEIEIGYNNCDHMVCAIIGEAAGIYDALGINVSVTQTNNTNIAQAMSTGEMQAGYMGITGAIDSYNEGAPLSMAAANHLGGSYYLVVGNHIETPEDLIGKTLAIAQNAENRVYWRRWTRENNIPTELENYNVVDMGQADGPMALSAGQIDAFVT